MSSMIFVIAAVGLLGLLLTGAVVTIVVMLLRKPNNVSRAQYDALRAENEQLRQQLAQSGTSKE